MPPEATGYEYRCEVCGHRIEGPELPAVVHAAAEHERAHQDGHIPLSDAEISLLRERIAQIESLDAERGANGEGR